MTDRQDDEDYVVLTPQRGLAFRLFVQYPRAIAFTARVAWWRTNRVVRTLFAIPSDGPPDFPTPTSEAAVDSPPDQFRLLEQPIPIELSQPRAPGLKAEAPEAAIERGEVRGSLEIRLHFDDPDETEGTDVLETIVHLEAANGESREHRAFNLADSLLDFVFDHPETPVYYSKTAPDVWSAAFVDSRILTGIKAMRDDREYRPLKVENEEKTIGVKYLGLSFDLAFLSTDGPWILVRMSGLHDEDAEEMPPVVFRVSLDDLSELDTAVLDESEGAWVAMQ